MRNVGMHAGGVLIAPGRLTDFCPLYAADGAQVVSQLDKDDVEAVGLVKFDFLGLTTLTILDWGERYARQLGDKDFALARVPLDDAQTYKLLSSGNTTAVFQLESRGMRDLIKRAPGPLRGRDRAGRALSPRSDGPHSDYIERKHGLEARRVPRSPPAADPRPDLRHHGLPGAGDADRPGDRRLYARWRRPLRRAMGKKKPEEMAQQRDIFVAGAQKNGVPHAKAMQLFDLMEKFAGYGFNKSHAAAYALLAYHTAYMKAHHAAAFAAANLSAVMDDTDKVRQFHDDAVANGLTVLPPDVNASQLRFVPVDRRTIRYGLGAVRGTGQSAIESIVTARASGAFTSLYDFCSRVDKRLVNRRVLEALIRAGAFDAVDANRARLLASAGRVRGRRAGRAPGEPGEPLRRSRSAARRRAHHGRDAALGRATEAARGKGGARLLSRAISSRSTNASSRLSAHAAREARARGQDLDGRHNVAARAQMPRRGRMMVVMLDDATAQVEISVFNELFERHREKLKEDALLIVCGSAGRPVLGRVRRRRTCSIWKRCAPATPRGSRSP